MMRTVYVTKNGLLEPLGQSQVLAYLRGLAKDFQITLITYEKSEDLANLSALLRTQDECADLGITWLPQRFRTRPRLIAPATGMIHMTWLLWRTVATGGIRLIHARSYIPAAVSMLVGRLSGVPFIFDMRALWPEELITAGRLRHGSLLHRAIMRAEAACLSSAGAVVSLTHAAVGHLRSHHPEALEGKPVAVIPTCADLDRFVPVPVPSGPRVMGCLGTILSGWFRTDWLSAFLQVAARRDPEVRFHVTTRDEPAKVRAAIGGGVAVQAKLQIAAATSEEVPALIQQQTASIMFFTDGLSKLGSSPTRMGEVLGCGIPVVANCGVGDVATIVQTHRVGVLAMGCSPQEMETAYDELLRLLDDPELPRRCRRAAEEIFSLESGTEAYRTLYYRLLGCGKDRDEGSAACVG